MLKSGHNPEVISCFFGLDTSGSTGIYLADMLWVFRFFIQLNSMVSVLKDTEHWEGSGSESFSPPV